MVNFYARKIKNGDITLEDVPVRWRDKTKEKLIEDGFLIEKPTEPQGL